MCLAWYCALSFAGLCSLSSVLQYGLIARITRFRYIHGVQHDTTKTSALRGVEGYGIDAYDDDRNPSFVVLFLSL